MTELGLHARSLPMPMWRAIIGIAVLLLLFQPDGIAAAEKHAKFNCTSEFGTFPNLYSCESYWICQYGAPLAATCNFGLIYSHKTLNCDWAKVEICTVIGGKVIRDWTPPEAATAPPYAGPAWGMNATSGGSLGNSTGNFTNVGLPKENLNLYMQLVAKFKKAQKIRIKAAGPTTPRQKTTTMAKLFGPDNFVLNDDVTSAPNKMYTIKPVGDQPIPCSAGRCRLPDCYCNASTIPNGIEAKSTPQIVMVTFDDAINGGNVDLLNEIFAVTRTNPNGCPILGTYFLANQWTDYNIVKKMYQGGHEIASHSLSHKDFSHYTEDGWRQEFVGEAEVARQLAGVNRTDIVGMRAPYLAIGGNKMFNMLWNNGFLYDSSIPSSMTTPPLWPYTLDSPLPHKCFQEPCPTGYFPGLWEVPMTYFIGLNDVGCSMYDACTLPSDQSDLTDVFYTNFLKHYTTNRSPFLLSAHSAWYLNNPGRAQALEDFIDKALKLGDVWFVTVHQTIQWMQDPTPLSEISKFAPWQCKQTGPATTMSPANVLTTQKTK